MGKMTMAALDSEMLDAEKQTVIKTDNSYCQFSRPRLSGLTLQRHVGKIDS